MSIEEKLSLQEMMKKIQELYSLSETMQNKNNEQDVQNSLLWEKIDELQTSVHTINEDLKEFRQHMDNGWRLDFLKSASNELMKTFYEMQKMNNQSNNDIKLEKIKTVNEIKKETFKNVINKILWFLGILLLSLLGLGGIGNLFGG